MLICGRGHSLEYELLLNHVSVSCKAGSRGLNLVCAWSVGVETELHNIS